MKRCLLALSLLSLWTLAMEGKKFLLVFVLWPRSIRFDFVHDLCRLSQTMRVAPLRGLPVVPVIYPVSSLGVLTLPVFQII